ncbi:MAG: hypothetical protein AABZ67_03260, partial [Pseudomonadota bacterium]
MRAVLFNRFLLRNGGQLFPLGNAQNPAAFYQIEILVDECVGIFTVEADQHLLQRHALGLQAGCDLTQRFAALYRTVFFCACGRYGNRRRNWPDWPGDGRDGRRRTSWRRSRRRGNFRHRRSVSGWI